MYDVAIIGAGPAGATLARMLGPRMRVLLVDRRHLVAPARGARDVKCCGGLVAPDAQKLLAELGLGLPRDVLVDPQLFAVRAVDVPTGLVRLYQRHYINIDRARFDRWLVSLISGGVDFREGCVLQRFEARPDGVHLHLACRGRTSVERARMLVGADGAGSRVRGQLASARPARTYLALQESFEVDHPACYYGAIFDPRVTDFYAWSIPKDGRLILGAALAPGVGARERFEHLKRRLRRLGLTLGRSAGLRGAKLVRPGSLGEICCGRGRVVLIGEAAGWVSPSSGEGLSYAMASARAAAEALALGPGGAVRRYRHAARRLRGNMLAKLVKCRLLYRPVTRRLVMLAGIGGMAPAGTALPVTAAPAPLPPGVL